MGGYSYDFGYYGDEAIIEEMMTGFGFAFLGVIMVFALIALAVAVAAYVFNSIGIYTIANRRGIRNAWLAWIPVANCWIVGSISDQYQYLVKGKQTNRRKILLILSICSTVLSMAVNGAETMLMITGSEGAAFASGALAVISGLAGTAISITLLVFHYIAMYDLYTSVNPQNNVLFLVMSIIFNFTEPFFVFFNRKRDAGMPPRRKPAEEEPYYMPEPAPEPAPDPIPEPWENPEE